MDVLVTRLDQHRCAPIGCLPAAWWTKLFSCARLTQLPRCARRRYACSCRATRRCRCAPFQRSTATAKRASSARYACALREEMWISKPMGGCATRVQRRTSIAAAAAAAAAIQKGTMFATVVAMHVLARIAQQRWRLPTSCPAQGIEFCAAHATPAAMPLPAPLGGLLVTCEGLADS